MNIDALKAEWDEIVAAEKSGDLDPQKTRAMVAKFYEKLREVGERDLNEIATHIVNTGLPVMEKANEGQPLDPMIEACMNQEPIWLSGLDAAFELLRVHAMMEPPASLQEIRRWEEANGVHLPEDVIRLYQLSNSFCLGPVDDPTFCMRPICALEGISQAIYGQQMNELCGAKVYSFIELHDGNFVGLDLLEGSGTEYRLVDVFHESFINEWRKPRVISSNLADILPRMVENAFKRTSYWWL